MKRQDLIQTAIQYSDLLGPPGFEGDVRDYTLERIRELFPEATPLSPKGLCKHPEAAHTPGVLTHDKMNNISFALPQNDGRRLRVLLDAHLDEVAFMVRGITENGLLRMQPLGGWAPVNIGAEPFIVISKQGEPHYGVTASKPPHYMTEEEKSRLPQPTDFLLDIGTRDPEQIKKWNIDLGCPIIPAVKAHYDEDLEIIHGKAFDCRIGCAALLNILDEIKDETFEMDVYAAFSAQEEIGIRGAEVLAKRLEPDLAIVFEGCPADDSYGNSADWQTALGKGPMLRHIDVSMITHPGFQHWALQQAAKYDIPIQTAVRQGGGTNGKAYHLSRKATPTIVVGIPVRYAHTHYGQCAIADVEAATRLVKEILKDLTETVFEAL